MIVRKAPCTILWLVAIMTALIALMIVSRLCYIAILKDVLPSFYYNDVNMNICISME